MTFPSLNQGFSPYQAVIASALEKANRERLIERHDRVLLLGMGGSSLAPEVLFKTFGATAKHPSLAVLNSTDAMWYFIGRNNSM